MDKQNGEEKKFEIDFSGFDLELKGLLLQITKNYKKNQKPSTKKTRPIRSSKSKKSTTNRKIVKLDLKKIRETIEQSIAMAKKNNEDAK